MVRWLGCKIGHLRGERLVETKEKGELGDWGGGKGEE